MSDSAATAVIGVLSWHAPDYLDNLLKNVAGLPPSCSRPWRLVVLDQESSAETRTVIERHRQAGTVSAAAAHGGNLGFAGGHNALYDLAWRQQPFDHYVILNQDVLFGETGWLDRLLTPMEHSQVGLTGPVMMRIRFAERVFEKLGPGYQANESDRLFVECSVAAVKARAVAEAGFFDTAFHPAYSEDCDLSLRFRHCGWRLANMSINHIHNYFAQAAKRQRLAELDVRHGDFRTRHLETLFQRWAQPPSFERQDIRRLFPGVYFPGLPA